MTELVKEWVKKAEGDYRLAILGIKNQDPAIFDGVCFHCQQCAEKYLKALLVREQIHFEKKHDLIYCLNLLVENDSFLEFIREELRLLNDYAVDIRYPGDHADLPEALEAIKTMKTVRKILRSQLGLSIKKARAR
ncbi:MAG: HEPN domain-containing protein [Bacteroidetes bacterium]|nr:MAG: HEPN domain-containing protein [Bacteroidota bacterium]